MSVIRLTTPISTNSEPALSKHLTVISIKRYKSRRELVKNIEWQLIHLLRGISCLTRGLVVLVINYSGRASDFATSDNLTDGYKGVLCT